MTLDEIRNKEVTLFLIPFLDGQKISSTSRNHPVIFSISIVYLIDID